MTTPIPTPPTCTCSRPAHWLITGEDGGGAVLVTGYACDSAQHQAQCRSLAWQIYNVAVVKTRRLLTLVAPVPTATGEE